MNRRLLILLLFCLLVFGRAQKFGTRFEVIAPTQIIVNRYLDLSILTNCTSSKITYSLNDYSFAFQQTDFGWQSKQLITPELCPPGIYDLKIFVHLSNRQDYLQAEELMKRGIGEILKGKLYLSKRLLVLPQQPLDQINVRLSPQPVRKGELLTIIATIPTQTISVAVSADKQLWPMEYLDGFDYLLQIRPQKDLNQLNIVAKTLSKKILSKVFYVKIREDLPVSDNQEWEDPVTTNQDFFELTGQKSIAISSFSFNGDTTKRSGSKREEFLEVYLKGREDQVQVESEIYVSDSQYLQDSDRLKLKLFTDDWQFFFGDFYETSSYLTLQQKKLKGVYYSYGNNYARLKIATAKAQGNNHQEYLYGNDSQGPFVLTYKSILIGSETVVQKGRILVRAVDYFIDYNQGKITLINDLLKKEDTLFVSYQYQTQYLQNQMQYLTYEQLFGQQHSWRAGYFELKRSERSFTSNTIDKADEQFKNSEKIYNLATSLNYNKLKFYLEHNGTEKKRQPEQADDFRASFEDEQLFLNFANRYVGKDYPCFGNTQLQNGTKEYLLDLDLKRLVYLDYSQKDNFLIDQKQTLLLSNFCLNNFSWLHQQQYLNFASQQNDRLYQKDQLKLSYPLTENFIIGFGGEKELLQDLDFQKYNNSAFTFFNLKTKNNFDFSAEAKKYYVQKNDCELTEDYQQQDLRLKLLIAQLRDLRLNLSYFNSFNDIDGERDVLSFDLLSKYFVDLKSSYRINNFNENYNTQTLKIRKVKGLLSVKFSPVNFLQLKYDFKPVLDYLRSNDNLVSLKDISNFYLLDFYLFNCSWQYHFYDNYLISRDPFSAQIKQDSQETINGILLKTALVDNFNFAIYQTNSDKSELNNNLELVKTKNFLWGLNNYWRIDPRWLLIAEYKCVDKQIQVPTADYQQKELDYRLQSDYQIVSALIWKLFGQKTEYFSGNKQETSYGLGSGLGYQFSSLNIDLNWQLKNCNKNEQLGLTILYQPRPLVNLSLNLQKSIYHDPQPYQELLLDFKLVLKF